MNPTTKCVVTLSRYSCRTPLDPSHPLGKRRPVFRGAMSIWIVAFTTAHFFCAGVFFAQSPQSLVHSSVPSGPLSNTSVQLTLNDAVTMATQYNLGAIERDLDARIQRGQRLLALSALLPNISAGLSEHANQISASTLGIPNNPVIPRVLGPYSYTSVGANLAETLFSVAAIEHLRAAKSAEQAAQLNYTDALDVITLAVGNEYLRVIEARSRIEAQNAQVLHAQALYNQALDGFRAGTRPRIDVTRTQVELQTEQYSLSVYRNDFAIAKLTLARAIGLPLGQEFQLTEDLPYSDLQLESVESALRLANQQRSDLRASLASQQAAEQKLAAAKAERYPTASTNANYEDVGTTLSHSHGNFGFEAEVSVPLFTGGRVKADIVQAQAALDQRKAETESLRGQLDYDIRTAFLNLNAAKEQVDVAHRNVDLAKENLTRSQDRFSTGVTDSVEVVQAEQSLASANDQYITSLYGHNLSKLELARALGISRTAYKQYLGGK